MKYDREKEAVRNIDDLIDNFKCFSSVSSLNIVNELLNLKFIITGGTLCHVDVPFCSGKGFIGTNKGIWFAGPYNSCIELENGNSGSGTDVAI